MSGYDLDPTTPSAQAAQASYTSRSIDAAALPDARLDMLYGPHPRHRLDLFPAAPGAPALVFFHGGYWKAGSKDERRFPAIEWRRRGVSWIAVNYRLVPDVTLAETVNDARMATAFICRNARQLGIDPRQIHLVGNSAGGHLAAMAAAGDWADGPSVRSVTGISGLYDLVALLDASPNSWLKLDALKARALSPIFHLPKPDLPVLICYGDNETGAFKWQSENYATACRANGNQIEMFESPNTDHFQIIAELGCPDTPVFDRLESLVLNK